MNPYTRLIFKDHGVRVDGDDIFGAIPDEKPGKRSYAAAFGDELANEDTFAIRNLRAAISKDMVKSLKVRDRFISASFTKPVEESITKWMTKLLGLRKKTDTVDVYADTSIAVPTEESINSYNMLMGLSYEYSEFTPRNADLPHVTWSGFNSAYKSARDDTPFIQAMLSFTILEQMSKDMLDVDVEECVQDYYYVPGEKIEPAVEEILESITQKVYYDVVKKVDLTEALESLIKYADYMNGVGIVGYYPNKKKSSGKIYETNYLLSRDPVNLISDIRDIVVIKVKGEDKRGYDVKADTEITIVTGTENTLTHHLCDELRFNELTHEFVIKSTPFRYIITDNRSEQNSGDKKKDEHKKLEGEFNKLHSAAARATNKTQADSDKMAFQIREMETKSANDRERRIYRDRMRERSERMHKLRSDYAEEKFRRSQTDSDNKSYTATVDRQIRQLSELNKMQSSQESMHQKYMNDSTKRINEMIDKRANVEYKEGVWQRELATKLMNTTKQSSSALNGLLSQVSLATDKISKVTGNNADSFITNKSFVPTEALDRLSEDFNSTELLMQSLCEATSHMSQSQDVGNGETKTRSQHEIKTLIDSIDQRVNFMLIKNFAQFDEDCKKMDRQGEEMYSKIEQLLKHAEDETLPNSVKMDYERDKGFFSFDLQNVMSEFSEHDSVADAKITEAVPSMASEIADITGSSTNGSVIKIADAQVSKLLNTVDKNNKRRMQACRTFATESLLKEKQYMDLSRKHVRCQVESDKNRSMFNDANALNKILTQTMQTDTNKLQGKIKSVSKQLYDLKTDLAESEKKAKSRSDKFTADLQDTMSKLNSANDKSSDGLKTLQQEWGKLEVLHLNPTSQNGKPTYSDFIARQAGVLDNMHGQFQNQKLNTETIFNRKVKDLTDAISKVPVPQRPKANLPNAGPVQYPAPGQPVSVDKTQRTQLDWELAAVKKENDANKKALDAALDEFTKRGLKDTDDWNKLKASGWNSVNSVKTSVGIADAETIHLVDETYCKSELSHAVKKENVEFLQTSLRDKWDSHVKSLFPDKVRVTKTGTVVREKSASKTLFYYVFPWLRIRYGEQNISQTFSYATSLFKSDMGTFELIKSILLAKQIHFKIRSSLLRRGREKTADGNDGRGWMGGGMGRGGGDGAGGGRFDEGDTSNGSGSIYSRSSSNWSNSDYSV